MQTIFVIKRTNGYNESLVIDSEQKDVLWAFGMAPKYNQTTMPKYVAVTHIQKCLNNPEARVTRINGDHATIL